MKRSVLVFISFLAGAFSWVIFRNFEVRRVDGGIQILQRPLAGEEQTVFTSRPSGDGPAMSGSLPGSAPASASIRVAAFNLHVMGETKLSKPHVVDLLARIVRRFDIVAVQEIRSKTQDSMPHFVDAINAAGRRYDYVVSQRLGESNSKEQYAFIFDTQTIEIDRRQLYTVHDPDDLLHREPMVGWFRVRGPNPDEAFTFTLVNLHVDPSEAQHELSWLDDIYQKVLNDGRNEDDVIFLGDFNANERQIGPLCQAPDMTCLIQAMPTNTRGTQQYDNIVLNEKATREFTGRGGVFDFLREFNLSMEEALEVSDHLPVWAEFFSYEGGQVGKVARGGTLRQKVRVAEIKRNVRR